MNIAINISGQFGSMTGVQHYVDSLLLALYESETQHCITAFVPQVWSPTLLADARNSDAFHWMEHSRARMDTAGTNCYLPVHNTLTATVNRRLLHPLRARAAGATEWAARRAARRYDVLHTPAIACPPDASYRARRNVCTLYDMTALTHAWAHENENLAASEMMFAYAKTCDRILTISEYSKQEICACLHLPSERVDVTPLAPRVGTRPVADAAECRAELAPFGLADRPFALYAGTLEPRKNLPRLLCAWANICRQPDLRDHTLVLAGGAWSGQEESVRTQAAELGIGNRVLLTGYVSGQTLNALMTACAVFVYVSEAEGFGLPPLEAMACGAPVVASDTTSLPEVMGDAGLLIDPLDTDAIAAALHHLLTDEAENARLRTLSVQQAAQFSWARTAELTLKSYEAAAR